MTAHLRMQRTYTRSDPRGLVPRRVGAPDLDVNRLAVTWRPMIDMCDSAYAARRLRAIPVVSGWLAAPGAGHRPWFSMIGVAGQRHQVLRHAGLDRYDCAEPAALPPGLRTPRWSRLTEAVAHFADADWATRTLVVFHLAQLSFCGPAVALAKRVGPGGCPPPGWYRYEVARVRGRLPGQAAASLAAFTDLARSRDDDRVALAACFQGIGHTLHTGADPRSARWFHERGERLAARAGPGDWHTNLLRTRYHRAAALLGLAERDADGQRRHLDLALLHHAALAPDPAGGAALAPDPAGGAAPPDDAARLVIAENHRYLLELRLRCALAGLPGRARDDDTVLELCRQLADSDPYCVEARLLVGDAHAAIGRYGSAARWYERAGALATGAGAVGWFRAGQCWDAVGDRARALNAMGRCLELDASAVEPGRYLRAHA